MIHVTVGDEEELLGNGALRASADIEGQVKGGEDNASLVPCN